MGILHSTCRFFGCKTEDEEEGEFERPIYPYLLDCNRGGDSSSRSSACSSILNAVLQGFRFLFRFVWRRKTTYHILPTQNTAPGTSREPLLAQTTNSNFGRSQCGILDVLSYQQRTEKRQRDRDVVLSIPGFACPLGITSASCKSATPSSTVSVRKDAPRNVPIVKERLGMKKPDPEEERKVKLIKSSIIHVVSNERWIKHYSSRHRILLVGEGDFSFSASLAVAFSSASNIIATSLNSQAFLKKNYIKAASNIENLRRRESKVMHEVDASKMANHPLLGHLKFDRIIFNFPYAGLALKNLPRESQLRSHRSLVDQFLKNAREMLSENGEIHISHKTNGFHVEFKLESTASSHRLRLIEAVPFNNLEYPGYNTKYGFGGDNNFNCNPSKTYKFGLKKFQHY